MKILEFLEGMSCMHCVNAVKSSLSFLKGVSDLCVTECSYVTQRP
ncbi:MAG TPA: heavy-metal-associated domain-containing protein [Gelria sp.]|nr:heavy-metal-associated domain-containing protein [Gelria sp.]